MGQLFTLLENVAPLVKASSTTITMAPTYLGQATRIQVGGQSYTTSSTITLNTATTGFNGLDTGSLASNQLYYIYAVVSSGLLGLVASTAAPGTGPTGFLAWKEVGRFRTFLGSAAIAVVINRILGNNRAASKIQLFSDTTGWTASNFGTVTALTSKEFLVGNTISAQIVFTSGTPVASSAILNLPYSMDTTLLGSEPKIVGNWFSKAGTSSIYNTGREAYLLYDGSTANQLFRTTDTSSNAYVKENANVSFSSGAKADIALNSVPVVEFAGLFTD